MKAVTLLIVFHLAGAGLLAPMSLVHAGVEGTEKVARTAKKDQASRECRRIKETGSRIAKRVCKHPQAWEREEAMAKENIEQTREGANRNTAVSGQQ